MKPQGFTFSHNYGAIASMSLFALVIIGVAFVMWMEYNLTWLLILYSAGIATATVASVGAFQQRQRLWLAAALVMDASILFLLLTLLFNNA